MFKKLMIVVNISMVFVSFAILTGCSNTKLTATPSRKLTSTFVPLASTLPILENITQTVASPITTPVPITSITASSGPKNDFLGTIAIVGTFRENLSLVLLDENERVRDITGMAYNSLSWSLDDQWIAFSGGLPDLQQQPDIFIIKPDGKSLKQLTSNSFWEGEPAWSPDGKRIVYVYRNASASSDIAWVDINSGETHSLTSTKGDESRPVWSSDGKRIVYLYSENLLTWELWMMDIDTTTTHRILDTPMAKSIDWSPDRDWIAFVSPNKSSLCGDIYLLKAL